MPIQGLVELNDPKNLEDFINQIINMYFKATDVRTKESCLSVYMAFRDHYPSYLKSINLEKIKVLNDEIEKSSGKLIKLRRIALSELAKVA